MHEQLLETLFSSNLQTINRLKCICVVYGTLSSGKFQTSLTNKQEAVCTWVASDFIDRTIKTQSLCFSLLQLRVEKLLFADVSIAISFNKFRTRILQHMDNLQTSIFNVT